MDEVEACLSGLREALGSLRKPEAREMMEDLIARAGAGKVMPTDALEEASTIILQDDYDPEAEREEPIRVHSNLEELVDEE